MLIPSPLNICFAFSLYWLDHAIFVPFHLLFLLPFFSLPSSFFHLFSFHNLLSWLHSLSLSFSPVINFFIFFSKFFTKFLLVTSSTSLLQLQNIPAFSSFYYHFVLIFSVFFFLFSSTSKGAFTPAEHCFRTLENVCKRFQTFKNIRKHGKRASVHTA